MSHDLSENEIVCEHCGKPVEFVHFVQSLHDRTGPMHQRCVERVLMQSGEPVAPRGGWLP